MMVLPVVGIEALFRSLFSEIGSRFSDFEFHLNGQSNKTPQSNKHLLNEQFKWHSRSFDYSYGAVVCWLPVCSLRLTELQVQQLQYDGNCTYIRIFRKMNPSHHECYDSLKIYIAVPTEMLPPMQYKVSMEKIR